MKPGTQEAIAQNLAKWTSSLDDLPHTQLLHLIASASMQLAKRVGPDEAAESIVDLALTIRPRGSMQ